MAYVSQELKKKDWLPRSKKVLPKDWKGDFQGYVIDFDFRHRIRSCRLIFSKLR